MKSIKLYKHHPYHILPNTSVPYILSGSLVLFVLGLLLFFHSSFATSFAPGNILFLLIGLAFTIKNILVWSQDIFGALLFIISETMLFFGFFWAFFHTSLNPSIFMGGVFPPIGIEPLNPAHWPLINTLTLLLSGVFVNGFYYTLKLISPLSSSFIIRNLKKNDEGIASRASVKNLRMRTTNPLLQMVRLTLFKKIKNGFIKKAGSGILKVVNGYFGMVLNLEKGLIKAVLVEKTNKKSRNKIMRLTKLLIRFVLIILAGILLSKSSQPVELLTRYETNLTNWVGDELTILNFSVLPLMEKVKMGVIKTQSSLKQKLFVAGGHMKEFVKVLLNIVFISLFLFVFLIFYLFMTLFKKKLLLIKSIGSYYRQGKDKMRIFINFKKSQFQFLLDLCFSLQTQRRLFQTLRVIVFISLIFFFIISGIILLEGYQTLESLSEENRILHGELNKAVYENNHLVNSLLNNRELLEACLQKNREGKQILGTNIVPNGVEQIVAGGDEEGVAKDLIIENGSSFKKPYYSYCPFKLPKQIYDNWYESLLNSRNSKPRTIDPAIKRLMDEHSKFVAQGGICPHKKGGLGQSPFNQVDGGQSPWNQGGVGQSPVNQGSVGQPPFKKGPFFDQGPFFKKGGGPGQWPPKR